MSDEAQHEDVLPETLTRRTFLRRAAWVVGGGSVAVVAGACGFGGGGSSKKPKPKKSKKSKSIKR